MMMSDDFREKVFRAVAMIPEGRVASYAQVAELADVDGAARAVGNALHFNTDPVRVPCHRVVHADGRLADGYAFGGPEKQKERLLAEGVVFLDSAGGKVDMGRCGIVIEDHPLVAHALDLACLSHETGGQGRSVPEAVPGAGRRLILQS